MIELCIRDNGGADTNQTFSGHYGWAMRERAEAAGVVDVTSQPGHGTELTIRWNQSKGPNDNLFFSTDSRHAR